MRCPICKKTVDLGPSNRYRPFCSERCQLIDLGRWAGEDYRVTGTRPDPDREHPDDRALHRRNLRDDADE